MAKQTLAADIRNWTERAKRNMRLVALQSIQDVGEQVTRRAAGTSDGGTHKEGFVPVVSGELINSHQISINGGVVLAGTDYGAGLTGMRLGDTVSGTFGAKHAAAKEYGYTTTTGKQVPGWFFVRNGVNQWPAIVAANVAKLKD